MAQVRYPRFGEWNVTLRTNRPGQAEVSITEQISPSGGTTSTGSERRPPPTALNLLFTFDWHDALNIAVRIAHSVGAATYLGAGGLMMLGLWLDRYLADSPLWSALERSAFPLAIGSLLVLTASGLYTGYFDAPVRAPGVFNGQALAAVPFGYQYAAAFSFKILFGFAVLLVLWRTRQARRDQKQAGFQLSGNAGVLHFTSATGGLAVRLTLGFGVLAVLLLANVVVLVYLHYISHLGSALPVS